MMKDDFAYLKQLADGIVAMFGSNCEVAVHDLRDLRHSLVHLAGNITGRKIGAPATDLLLRELSKEPSEIVDIYNYKTTTENGRSIKSTTLFLRNSEEQIHAAFCINLDTTELFNASQLLAKLIETDNSVGQKSQESFTQSAEQTIADLFSQTVVEIGKQPASMSTAERVDLVKRLHKKGVFQMKGSVNQIAELSGVTKYTIYNYLKNLGYTSNSRHRN